MKILMASHGFDPDVGGIETMSLILAREFSRQGHEVIVATQSVGEQSDNWPFKVVRRPRVGQLWLLVKWCDVFFHNNICLQMAWPLLLVRRPWVIAHHTWITRTKGGLGWQDRLKRFVLRFATNISVSQAMAAHLPVASIIIGNCYRDDIFREMPEVERNTEIVFLGRLVSDKGVDLLLEALGKLKAQSLSPALTVVGEGPELSNLQQLAEKLTVAEQVCFVGKKVGEDLVRVLNKHHILAVPSRWNEPFGLVALEGIACGCVVVGSQGGGLVDAIGPCGVTFPNGDVQALTQMLHALLADTNYLQKYKAETPLHLSRHRQGFVAKAYLEVLVGATRLPGHQTKSLHEPCP